MHKSLKNELLNILSGKNKIRFGTIIQTIACYLKDGEETSTRIENEKYLKEQERQRLEDYISEKNLWLNNIDFSQYVSEGAE